MKKCFYLAHLFNTSCEQLFFQQLAFFNGESSFFWQFLWYNSLGSYWWSFPSSPAALSFTHIPALNFLSARLYLYCLLKYEVELHEIVVSGGQKLSNINYQVFIWFIICFSSHIHTHTKVRWDILFAFITNRFPVPQISAYQIQ